MSDLEHSPETGANSIELTAGPRAEYTRSFFAKQGPQALDKFVEDIKKPPFTITLEAANDKSLALGIAELQKKLGFAEEDQPYGCDGKFGPYTYKHYQEKIVTVGTKADLQDLEVASTPANRETSSVVTPQVEAKEIQPATSKDTILVGDSITVGYSRYMPEAKSAFKGGKSTSWMKKEFFTKYLEKNAAGKYELKPAFQGVNKPKDVVILGGVNDFTNGASAAQVVKNLTEMVLAATEAGMQVAVCTIPNWDTARWSDFYTKQWQAWYKRDGKGWNNGVYPYSGEHLAKQTDIANEQIRQLASKGIKVIDLAQEMADTTKYPRVDGLHPSPKGSQAMAKYIQKEMGIRPSIA